MNCECGNKTEVLETRIQHRFDLGPVVFRRRRCLNCGETFKTYEVRLDYEPGRVDFDDTEEETADST